MFKNNLNKIIFSGLFVGLSFGLNFLYADFFVIQNNNVSLFLVGLHSSIANNSFDINNNIQQEGTLSLLKNIKEHATISIISMLEFSAIREVVLDKYLADTDKFLSDVGFAISNLKQDISLLKSSMNNCLDEKNLYDKKFFESINLYDQKYMDESLQKSIDAEKCSSENRIRMNAKIVLLDQFIYHADFIKTKYDYLVSKKDMIIRNFDFMKNGLLDELITTKEVLNTLGN